MPSHTPITVSNPVFAAWHVVTSKMPLHVGTNWYHTSEVLLKPHDVTTGSPPVEAPEVEPRTGTPAVRFTAPVQESFAVGSAQETERVNDPTSPPKPTATSSSRGRA